MSLSRAISARSRGGCLSSTAVPESGNTNLAIADRQPRPTRRQCSSLRRGKLAIAASLVGFNRPSPPWPTSMRGSSPGPVRELFTGTRRRSSQQQQSLFESIHHVGLLVQNLEKSLEFYQGVLGLSINNYRPDAKLPYRGAWLWVGRPEDNQMIHLMELPSPDPTEGRPAHGGRDRHFCVSVRSVDDLVKRLDNAGISFTLSASGRKAVFYRDPDSNVIECAEIGK